MRAIIVGRHKLSGNEGLEVADQKSINFPAASAECADVVYGLCNKAKILEAVLVFQAVPGQLAVALARIAQEEEQVQIGVIVNKPGARPAGIVKRFDASYPFMAETIAEAVGFANPRASIEVGDLYCEVTVDPPLRFEFSHIEWF